jgi:hypothetical protein
MSTSRSPSQRRYPPELRERAVRMVQAKTNDVELSSDVHGAVLSPAAAVLQTLEQLEDNIGDDRIAEALLGHHPGGGQ